MHIVLVVDKCISIDYHLLIKGVGTLGL